MMRVTLIAQTQIDRDALVGLVGETEFGQRSLKDWPWENEAETLVEFAGRACYQSWDMPSPATATAKGYHANIIAQSHFSVMEHASATFYVQGVSRSLLTELTRHRHLSFSVLSQRFVGADKVTFVVPPALVNDDDAKANLSDAFQGALHGYERLVELLEGRGLGRKQAREAARSVLPNMTETKFVVTGNHRAWREVIAKRSSAAADAEIRKFAEAILEDLRDVAPNLYADFKREGDLSECIP